MRVRVLLAVLGLLMPLVSFAEDVSSIGTADREAVIQRLVERHGEAHAPRIRRGVGQAAERWWRSDGDEFSNFCEKYFVTDPAELDAMFTRIQQVMEQVSGHLLEVRRELTTPLDLDTGPIRPVDELFGNLDLSAHVSADLFRSKVAFLALLNFPVHTLADRLEEGPVWDRKTWAQSRMMGSLAPRVPAEVQQRATQAFTAASRYVDEYNVRMDRLVDASNRRPFRDGLRLITHWGLRDELKSQYPAKDGLAHQRMIHDVMKRIVRQEIPAEVIDNPERLWNPGTNQVWEFDPKGPSASRRIPDPAREPDTRYQRLLDIFHAVRAADRYSPEAPSFIARRFQFDREIPEAEVEALLVSVLRSKEFADAAALVKKRLGRNLEAFDIWYDGFKGRGRHGEAQLDEIVRQRFPDVATFQRELPGILKSLGFSAERASWLADHIVVDPSRGAGHALGAVRREDSAHLRTRFGPNGMDYKGYNIAIHELGHNVEQVFSLNAIDHWWLAGVPNNAFTEALAFVFQNRDLELLGLASSDDDARALEALDTLWATAEIGGVALVDMAVWRWMYAHPEATAAELREATLAASRKVWNDYFAPVFGTKDEEILAIYSHMIVYGLYLPDYPLGHIIAFQVARQVRGERFGEEFERVARQGRLTPGAWMRGAVGAPLSAEALLAEARTGLSALAKR